MPRIIDQNLGQEQLGFWDFSWSLVNYLTLTGVGIGSGVSRYVSKYMASGNSQSISRVVISSYFLQTLVVIAGFILFFLLITQTSLIVPDSLHNESSNIGIILFLAASISFQLVLSPSRGVINGCHRWDITNIINVASRLLSSALMATVILLGGSLLDMAISYFLVTLIMETSRCIISFRICAPLTFSKEHIDFRTSIKMMKFGSSQFAIESLPLFYAQAISIIITQSLGPANLAIFARTQAILKYIELFISRHTRILMPTASALLEEGRTAELQEIYLNSTKFSLALGIPALLVYFSCGDLIISLWMSEQYVDKALIYTLSLGYLLPITMSASMNILIGINKHSYILWLNLSIITIGSVILFLFTSSQYELSLAILGGIMVLLLTITYGILTPLYCIHSLNISFAHFLRHCIVKTFACNIPLFIAVALFLHSPTENGRYFIVAALLASSLLYWHFLLAAESKERALKKIRAFYN